MENGSPTLQMKLTGPKSMCNRTHRDVANGKFPLTAECGPDGGRTVRNCSIWEGGRSWHTHGCDNRGGFDLRILRSPSTVRFRIFEQRPRAHGELEHL